MEEERGEQEKYMGSKRRVEEERERRVEEEIENGAWHHGQSQLLLKNVTQSVLTDITHNGSALCMAFHTLISLRTLDRGKCHKGR